MPKFVTFTSGAVPVEVEKNIDTDQIIPARFLKATERKGFGDNLLPRLALRRFGREDRVVPAERSPLRGGRSSSPGATSGAAVRASMPPGPSPTTVSRVVVSSFRRYFPQQRPEQRAAANPRQRRVSKAVFDEIRRIPRRSSRSIWTTRP